MGYCSEMAVSETAVSQLTLQNTQSLTNLSLSVNEILVGRYSAIDKRSIHASLFNVKLLEWYAISKVPYMQLIP